MAWVGSLVRFGLKFQANWFTWVAREQALNIVVVAVAGVASLGIWTFTNRIFLLPSLAFSSLFVGGFPAMSNLLARGEDPGPAHSAHGSPIRDRRHFRLPFIRGREPKAHPGRVR